MLPMPIRALRDAVIVLITIVIGGTVAALPYAAGAADQYMVWTFQCVFGTLAYALTGYLAPRKRALHLTMSTLIAWLLIGVVLSTGSMHPVWWVFMLAALAIMATLGGGLAVLVEKLARE